MAAKVLGIVGSYRKGGVVDSLVSQVLAAAAESGVETEKIYLLDKHIEFCLNCRACTQVAGTEPGECVTGDDMAAIIDKCRRSNGLVIGAPVNFFNVNALTRKFLERLVCHSYWPWGQVVPGMRAKVGNRRAVLISSCAMPGPLARIFSGSMRSLRIAARMLGAKPIASIFAGLSAQRERPQPSSRASARAIKVGRKLGRMLTRHT